MRFLRESIANLGPGAAPDSRRVDPKRALTVTLQQQRGLDPDTYRMAVNPLLADFLRRFIPDLDPATLEVIEEERQATQTDKGGNASFHSITVAGALLRNRGMDGLRVVCKWSFGSKRELNIWEQIQRRAIELPLPVDEPLSISFFTKEAWEKAVQEARRRPSIANADAVRRGIVAPELADRSSFATAKIHVDAAGLGVTIRTYKNRRDPEGTASIEPVVQTVVRRLERAVNDKKYLPRLEKTRKAWETYAQSDRQRRLNPENAENASQ